MLKNNFYTILSEEIGESSLKRSLRFNADHGIFKGHFPSIPIVPGVCMMQISKELLQDKLQKKLIVQSVGILKFLAMINPLENSEVNLELNFSTLEDDTYKADVSISKNELVFFKATKAIYK